VDTEAGVKVVRVCGKRGSSNFGRHGAFGNGLKCTKFILWKENKDSMECLSSLTKVLKVPAKTFAFAGTKDKRGVTTQWVTAFRVHPNRLAGINNTAIGWRVGNFHYVADSLQLGQLLGNRFTVVLRKITAGGEDINRAVESLKARGFINYFGMQRFGTSADVMTHDIGCAMLKNDWPRIADLLLLPRPGDHGPISRARTLYAETRSVSRTLAIMPMRCHIERSFLGGLKDFGETQISTAFCRIPRLMRMMYLHAVQSLIWNRAVSRRLREYGLKPVVGDLVFDQEKAKHVVHRHQSKNRGKSKAKEKPKPEGEDSTDQPDQPKISNETLTVLKEEDLSRFTIHDVVLPLPGMDIIFPEHKSHADYLEIMGELGITLEEFDHKFVDFSLHGSYRKILCIPADLTWEIVHHDDPIQPLSLTDLDLLDGKSMEGSTTGRFKSLKLSFNLDTASYATMALRELTRTDTSSGYYASLTAGGGVEGEGEDEIGELEGEAGFLESFDDAETGEQRGARDGELPENEETTEPAAAHDEASEAQQGQKS